MVFVKKSALQAFLLGVQLCYFSAEAKPLNLPRAQLNKRYSSQFLTEKTQQYLVDGAAFPYIPFDIGESYGGNLPINRTGAGANATGPAGNTTNNQELFFWFFPSQNPKATDEIMIWLNGGPGASSINGVFGENGPVLWRPGNYLPAKNPWAHNRLTNLVYIDQPVGAGFSLGTPTGAGSAETAQQFLGFWRNFADVFGLADKKVYITGVSYAGQYVPYIASAMLDSDDIDLQGSMVYDPAISDDVPLVEVPMLAYTEYWQDVLKLNATFLDEVRQQHAEAGYTDFFAEWFTFPPKGVMPPANNTADFSSRIRGLITSAMALLEPCFNVYHITDTCPSVWSTNAANAWPLPPYVQAGIQDPLLNPGDSGPYLNLTVVRDLVHAPPGREWRAGSQVPVFTNPLNATSGDGSPRALLTVLPGVFERTPGVSLVVNGQLDMLIPSNGTLLGLQNATWRGAQGFSEYPSSTLQLPLSGLSRDDEDGYWSNFTALEGAGRSGEQGKWVFERGVGFVDVAYAGHGVGRYNAAAMFRIIEVLLGRMGVEEGFGGGVEWSLDIAGPAPEYGAVNASSI
ncbi:unnamed protein product [Discula destructiva]